MAQAVWEHYTTPADDPKKTNDLLALVKDEGLVLEEPYPLGFVVLPRLLVLPVRADEQDRQ